MFKSIKFLFEYVWRFNKKYILYALFYQVLVAITPMVTIILPKFIIDELINQQRVEYLATYVTVLISIILIVNILTPFMKGKMLVNKSIVFYRFQAFLTATLADCDFEQLESADFLDVKEKAHKFLYANGQGFGLIESAFNIIGKAFIFVGFIAIISTLNIFVVIIFIALVLITSYFESRNRKKITELDLDSVYTSYRERLAQIAMHRMWTAERKEREFLA